MSAPSLNTLIELGAISEAQGLQGQVKVRPHSPDPVALLSSKIVWLSLLPRRAVGASTSSEEASLTQYKVKSAKMHSGNVVVALDGVTDRDQALALKGARILVERDAFPKADDDSYYWVDLIGCKAINLQDANAILLMDYGDGIQLVHTPYDRWTERLPEVDEHAERAQRLRDEMAWHKAQGR